MKNTTKGGYAFTPIKRAIILPENRTDKKKIRKVY
jgi:hypothetical protein